MKKIIFSFIFLLFAEYSIYAQFAQFYHLEGKIGTDELVIMDLQIKNSRAFGVYYSNKFEQYAVFKGVEDKNGNIKLYAKKYDTILGIFVGKIMNSVFAGYFKVPNKKTLVHFSLKNDCSQSICGARYFTYYGKYTLFKGMSKPRDTFSLSFFYPTIVPNPKIRSKLINALDSAYFGTKCDFPPVCITNFVDALIEGYKDDNKGITEKNSSNALNYECSRKTELIYNDDNFLTIKLSGYDYWGGVHGLNFTDYLNFDLQTGKIYSLFDIIQKSKKQQIIKKIKQNFIKQGLQDDISMDAVDIPEKFAILKDGILLKYSEYELGCYALGEPSAFLKFEDIKNYLTKNFREHLHI
jgi:hypothetical protein